jgi:hypothetical protein
LTSDRVELYNCCVRAQQPLLRLRQIALDLERFADALEADAGLDPAVFRYWRTELLLVAAELEREARATAGGDEPEEAASQPQ